MSTELAVKQTGRALIVADALTQEGEQRRLLGEYVAKHMVEGTDFGVIPGTERKDKDGNPAATPKTLLKPGAEKLTQLFRCTPRFTIEEKIEDWDRGLFYYRFSCQIVTQADGTVVAEGVGSCSTYESRYRWRTADRKCPECGAAAILRSKYPPKGRPEEPPGWYCFAKKGGCGANFDHGTEAVASQPVGRVQNPDLHDSANTVLKMAKKRALVDAALALARCSDIFTQDAEDFAEPAAAPEPAERPKPARAWTLPALAERLSASAPPADGPELGERVKWIAPLLKKLVAKFDPADLDAAVGDTIIAGEDWRYATLTPDQARGGWGAVVRYVAGEAGVKGGKPKAQPTAA